jgi:hypothetical protein
LRNEKRPGFGLRIVESQLPFKDKRPVRGHPRQGIGNTGISAAAWQWRAI